MPLNIINYTPLVENDGTVTSINRILGTIQFGGTWFKEIQSQETVLSLLRKLLSDRFTLVRNFTLPDEEIPIPILLISGSGVWMITVTDMAGIFKTQGNELLEIDSKTQEYVPKNPNLVMRTVLLTRAFEEFLQKHKISIPPIEPVLIFTDPGVDVTTSGDLKIRVVLIDALSRFISGLTVTPVRMEPGTAKKIIELIKYTHAKAQKKDTKKKSSGIKLNFSQTQWMIIGALAVFLLLTMVLLVFLLLNL